VRGIFSTRSMTQCENTGFLHVGMTPIAGPESGLGIVWRLRPTEPNGRASTQSWPNSMFIEPYTGTVEWLNHFGPGREAIGLGRNRARVRASGVPSRSVPARFPLVAYAPIQSLRPQRRLGVAKVGSRPLVATMGKSESGPDDEIKNPAWVLKCPDRRVKKCGEKLPASRNQSRNGFYKEVQSNSP